jgi:hypothetical protein
MATKKEFVDVSLKDVASRRVFAWEGLMEELKNALSERKVKAETDQNPA